MRGFNASFSGFLAVHYLGRQWRVCPGNVTTRQHWQPRREPDAVLRRHVLLIGGRRVGGEALSDRTMKDSTRLGEN